MSTEILRSEEALSRSEQRASPLFAGRVEVYAPKTMSDGVLMDAAGDLYMADPEHSAIVKLRADKTMQTVIKDDTLRWPDGFSGSADGWIYVTCSALHYVIGRLPYEVRRHAPYQVYRFRPDSPAAAPAAPRP